MKVGSKSILWGVHAWWFHPISVALAWRMWHGRWPNTRAEWIAIFCHDLGYWGCPDMDGECGKEHPWGGACVANKYGGAKAFELVLGHSKSFSKIHDIERSELCAPDKLSVLFDPMWFYLLRANLSGEIYEYLQNAPVEHRSNQRSWFLWYREKVRSEYYGPKEKGKT